MHFQKRLLHVTAKYNGIIVDLHNKGAESVYGFGEWRNLYLSKPCFHCFYLHHNYSEVKSFVKYIIVLQFSPSFFLIVSEHTCLSNVIVKVGYRTI